MPRITLTVSKDTEQFTKRKIYYLLLIRTTGINIIIFTKICSFARCEYKLYMKYFG